MHPSRLTGGGGDLPGSVRVACASDGGGQLDGHFGSCRHFLVYQVSPREARLVEVRAAGEGTAQRAARVADCQVLCVLSIGGPPAARVTQAGVHPVRCSSAGPAIRMVERLREVLAGSPPPWLAKAMGRGPEERVRFGRGGG